MRVLRKDQRGVASTVGTMLSLLVVLLFIQLAVLAPIPRQLYEAEWKTSQEALEAYGFLRSTLTGPMPTGGSISVRFPSGTPAVSPLASPSGGRLAFDAAATGPTMSFKFVPSFLQAEVTKLNQDVILLIDSSGSMGSSSCTPGSSNCNDPWGLRICGAQEYVANLRYPDRVAIIDFDGTARLVRTNHHLNNAGHDGRPDFADPRTDLGTIAPCNQRYGNSGWTNFGDAIRIANDEFNQYGDLDHVYIMILLTDGQNNQPWQDTMAQRDAHRGVHSVDLLRHQPQVHELIPVQRIRDHRPVPRHPVPRPELPGVSAADVPPRVGRDCRPPGYPFRHPGRAPHPLPTVE